MRIKKTSLYAVLASIAVFIFSIITLPSYIGGDQMYYRDFFETCLYNGYTTEQEFFCYQASTGSQEPIYFLIAKFAKIFFDKDIFIAISNSLLTYFSVLLVLKYHRVSWDRVVMLALLLTNYYFVVMLLAAERLKFSFIFLSIAILVYGNKKIIPFILAMLTHIQSALLIGPFYIAQIFNKNSSKLTKALVSFVFLFVSLGMFIFLREHIETKLTIYASNTQEDGLGFTSVIKTGVFIILAVVSTRKFLPLICGTPLVVLSYFLGSERIGMLAFILYLGFILYYKKRMDLMLFIVMIYFSYKSVGFISNVFLYGNGYNFS